MSHLSDTDIKKIAHLARLEIVEKNIPAYAKELSHILDFVEKMNSVDTKDIEPMAHPLDVPQPMRPDEVTESNQRDRFLKIAPATEAGLYLVPKVIPGE